MSLSRWIALAALIASPVGVVALTGCGPAPSNVEVEPMTEQSAEEYEAQMHEMHGTKPPK